VAAALDLAAVGLDQAVVRVPVEAAHVLEVACRARAAADRAPAVALVVADHALAVVLDRVASLAAARGRTSRGLAGAIDLR